MRSKLLNWLRRQLFARDGIQKLTVKHVLSGNKVGSEVHTFNGEQLRSNLTPDEFDTLVGEIEMVCSDDAAGIGGVQKYALLASFENGDTSRYVWRVQSGDEDGEGEMDSEPPTKAGLVAQQMRHNEAIMRTSTLSMGQVMTMQNRIIHRLSDQVDSMMGRHLELMSVLEDLRSEKHSRELAEKEQAFKLEQKKEITEKLMLLAPTVVNRLAGKPLLKEPITPRDMRLHNLMGSFKEEQFHQLSQVLSQDQMIAVMEIYQEELDRHEAMKKKKEAANGLDDPKEGAH